MIRTFLITVLLLYSACAQGVSEKRVSAVGPTEAKIFQKEVKVALLVGVSKYPIGSGLSPLHYAAADAEDLAALLKQQGYLVRTLIDGDAMRGFIENTLNDLSGMIDPQQGTFLFYFSGHGFSVQGRNYLAPIGASVSTLERDGLAVEDVVQLLAKSGAKRQLMFLDACRSDETSGAKGTMSRSFSAFESSQGLRILNSTKIGRVSYESSELQHGVFTAFLLQGLNGAAAGSDGLVTFHDLSDYVTESVRRWSNDQGKVQVPFEAVGTSEASGDFLLAGTMPASAFSVTPRVPAASNSRPLRVASTADYLLYTAAVRTRDPDQMEATAARLSNWMLASSLHSFASNARRIERGLPTVGISTVMVQLYPTKRAQTDEYAKNGGYAIALPLYQEAASTGDSLSMVNVGIIYRDALDTEQNYPEALKWFQAAADAGQPEAMAFLGMMYASGEGTPKDEALAFRWDQKAASLGNSTGMLGLGYCYQTGHGTAKNLAEAASWYRKAEALGDPTAKKRLQEMAQPQ